MTESPSDLKRSRPLQIIPKMGQKHPIPQTISHLVRCIEDAKSSIQFCSVLSKWDADGTDRVRAFVVEDNTQYRGTMFEFQFCGQVHTSLDVFLVFRWVEVHVSGLSGDIINFVLVVQLKENE